jgi:glycosyltransferase involved in cell wall biosynthesis
MLNDYALKVVPLHLEQCSLAIATSHRIKRELIGLAPEIDPSKIIVKANGINPDAFPVMNRRDPEEEQPYRLVSLSRIEPKKGLIYLVEAMRLLRDQDCNVELHVLGGVDDSLSSREYAQALQLKIRDLGVEHFVHLEGPKGEEEINRFFKNSHLYIAPFVETDSGDKDGIPTSLLEGMSSGLPVVATDAGSIPEVIEDGRDGAIVPQRDPNALALAISGLINDPQRRIRLGQNAARKVRESFEIAGCERIFHDHLLTFLGNGSATRRMRLA